MRLALSILLLLAGAQAALAGIESCEKIKDADAYNACLATYGPAVKEHGGRQAPPDDEPQAQEPGSKEPGSKVQGVQQSEPSREPARGGRRHHGRGARQGSRQDARHARKGRGRVRMELMVPSRR